MLCMWGIDRAVAAGERRIRVHTMCQPISSQLDEVLAGANQQNIVSFLAKMGAYPTPSLLITPLATPLVTPHSARLNR